MTLAITPYIYKNRYNKICFSINKEWSELANKLNEEIIMFCSYKNFERILNSQKIKAVILSGGGDIYKIKNEKINLLRDNFETKLTKYCFKKKIPVIAVCRGFQLLANSEGCKLKKSKDKRKLHSINIKDKNKNKKITVNSYHDIKIYNISRNFHVIGSCDDSSVEIAIHKKKKLLCFMMHPERTKNDNYIIKLFKNFIK